MKNININISKKHLAIIIVEIVVGVFLFTNIYQKIKVNKPASAPKQATVNTNSMEDHHKPKPIETVLFNSLTGKQAPKFSLLSYDGKTFDLDSLKGKNVLLFFNEGLMCYPACWNQISAFGRDDIFKLKNTVVLNITTDPKEDWKKAIEKMPELGASIVLFDNNRLASNLYGVLSLESSMHRGQFPGHTYVLIDKKGVVRYTKDDPTMAIRNQELLNEVDKI